MKKVNKKVVACKNAKKVAVKAIRVSRPRVIAGSEKLRTGEISNMAWLLCYSISHVSNILHGRRKDTNNMVANAVKRQVKGRRK